MALIKDLYLPTQMHLNHAAPMSEAKSLVNSKLHFGVELELEGCSYPLPSQGGTNVVGPYAIEHGIKAHADGSLRGGGIELVTKPCRGLDLVTQVHYITDLATIAKWQPSNRAGLHVHVDVQQLTVEQYLNLIKLYVLLEPCFFKAAGQERKGSIYCKSWFQSAASEDIKATLTAVKNGQWTSLPSRYFGMNINSLAKYGTIEFRHKHSTVDHDDIINWINIISKWYDYGISNTITVDQVRSFTPDSLLYSVFGNLDLMEHEYPSYFYHGCVPLWFDLFGPDTARSLDWVRKKAEAHKGYIAFTSKLRPKQPLRLRPNDMLSYMTDEPYHAGEAAPIPATMPLVDDLHLPGLNHYFSPTQGRVIYLHTPTYRPDRHKRPESPHMKVIAGRVWVWCESINRSDLFRSNADETEINAMHSGPFVYIYAR